MTAQVRWYLAVGPNVWGKGNTPQEAIKKARSNGNCRGMRASQFGVYECDEGTVVNEYGGVGELGPLVPGYTEWRQR